MTASDKPFVSISFPSKHLRGKIALPASKSESNRGLIIQALSKQTINLTNLSVARDTVILQAILEQLRIYHADNKENSPLELNVHDAGTAMRFLTAFCAAQGLDVVLTGTPRMQERPILPLVEALVALGARVTWLGNVGFPPFRLHGGVALAGGEVSIRGDISSQYISALLMIAPTLAHGLTIHLEGEIASRPYIAMTLTQMAQFGVAHEWREKEGKSSISVPSQSYLGGEYHIESDWSAASYWYSFAALADTAEFTLLGLRQSSSQGDSRVAELMKAFGVETTFTQDGAHIRKIVRKASTKIQRPLSLMDFSDTPDLAQTFAVLAAAKRLPLQMTGLDSLRIKETDRIAALQHELQPFGALLLETSPKIFTLSYLPDSAVQSAPIATYGDHRMAMAFAPLSLLYSGLIISEPTVVKKSYPDFWANLRAIGANVD